MAENKDYVISTSEDGSVNISEEVLAVIAWEAMLEEEGFGGAAVSLPAELAELIGKKNLAKGVRVAMREKQAEIDVYVNVRYGYAVTKVARSIQAGISKAIQDMTGIQVRSVDVHVSGITFDKTK